ncbi:50S ribosomal protein L13 [archaeon]|jgi:large subunit ribosomal protein L13|nr:50S ribosomal protein L13 [archaeon]MBT4647260.1 50S ribosomal protein L13 [archaeon]MBT6821177.1 50S ribosomal protein L13 [archaeon]MBT7391655.1 50S ribosomal protein L13 [archaeon]
MIVIDATNQILGRMATVVAKKALNGEKVSVVNCENAVISGDKKKILEKYKTSRERGTPSTGPFIHRYPDRMVRRTIRGMLPRDKARGKEAFGRVMCYLGVPEDLKDKEMLVLEKSDMKKLDVLKYIDLKTLSKRLGAKIE